MLHTKTDTSADTHTHTHTVSYLYTFIFTRNSLGRENIYVYLRVCECIECVGCLWYVYVCVCVVWLCMLERVLNMCLAGAGV